jgi:RNA polymerase sigma-70 factor, ECF subfamily
MSINETELIEKIRLRDHEAMKAVVQAHTVHLYNTCLGMGFPEAEADEITQSVWITFFDVIHRFEGRSSLRTFLFGILYNKASELRKKTTRAEPVENIEDIVDSHFDNQGHWLVGHSPLSPERFLESTQTMSLLAHCLELLPTTQKMAFVLKEVDEETTEDICTLLKVTATNLGVILFRARNQLRECVERKSR